MDQNPNRSAVMNRYIIERIKDGKHVRVTADYDSDQDLWRMETRVNLKLIDCCISIDVFADAQDRIELALSRFGEKL
jgi:hypothetical protein